MTATLLSDAIKNFPNASITGAKGRNLIIVGNEVYLPKRVVYGTVRLYNNDLVLSKEFANIYILCLDSKGVPVAKIPLAEVVKRLNGDKLTVINGIKFVYCAKVIEKGKYFKITVTLPIDLKYKLEKVMESGLFTTIDQVIEYALRRLFRRRRRV